MTKGFLERAKEEEGDYVIYVPMVPLPKEDDEWGTCVLSFDGPI